MIVVFGSINVDTIVTVDDLPAVGETVLCSSRIKNAGGKGANQAVAALKMNREVYFFGSVGQDNNGNMLLENLQSYGLDISNVSVVSDVSGKAYITVSKNSDNTIVYVPGANLSTNASQVHSNFFTKQTILLLQMEIQHTENWKLAMKAKRYGSRVVLNAAPACSIPDEVLENIDVLIMNQVEASVLARQQNLDNISPEEIARFIHSKYNISCIVTLGSDGVIGIENGKMYNIKALHVSSVDTTCAGDAFVGAFVSCIDAGKSFEESLVIGNAAGGLATTIQGSQKSLPSYNDILSAVNSTEGCQV